MDSHRKIVFHYQSLLVFLFVFTIYLLTAPKTVVLEDDGLFILASYFNGIAHSPGYPLFTLLGHIATYIPIGSVAYRVHALSGLFGAISCVFLYFIVVVLLKDRVFAFTAAVCLGLSKIFWSQSIIAEVYTLNAAIFLFLFFISLYVVEIKKSFSPKYIFLIFFVYGLGLSNHWPLLVLSTPALIAIWWPRKNEIFRCFLPGLIFLIIGLLPYAWMVIRSQMDPVISFYGPIESLKEFWFMVSRAGYAEQDSNIGAGYIDKIQFGFYAIQETLVQYGPLGGILGIIGFIRQWKYWNKNICISVILAYLGSTIILSLLLGFNFDLLNKNTFKVYPLISYSVFVIWITLGIKETIIFINNRLKINYSYQSCHLIFCLFLLTTTLLTNLMHNYRANDALGKNYALTILNSLKQDSVFITASDLDTGTLGYFNLIENVRPDVSLYNIVSLVFNTRLENPVYLDTDSNYEALSNFIQTEERPIYYVAGIPRLYGSKDYGIYLEIDKSLDVGLTSFISNKRVSILIDSLLQVDTLYDSWESMISKAVISDYCRVYMHLNYSGDEIASEEQIIKICRGYLALLTAAEVLLRQSVPNYEFINTIMGKAKLLQYEAKDLADRTRYNIVYAKILIEQEDYAEAQKTLTEAVNIWPDPASEAYTLIKAIPK